MLRPSHRSSRFSATRIFSGRTDERDAFAQAIAETGTQDSYKVLNWHGVGGQGKSALLREFQRMVAAFDETEARAKSGKQLIQAKVDFEDERLKRVDAALYSVRRQLAQESGYTFHTFDTAFIAYHSKTRPGADIGAAFPELFKGEKEGMMDLIDVLDDPLTVASHLASAALPGAGLIYKWGARLTGKLAKWWSTRCEQLVGIEHLQPEQLLERLPIYLGVDLCDNIKAKPDKRPVVLFDTYEALWANRGQKDSLSDRRADAWVRQLVQDAPGTLFVLAGRDALQWGEIDEAWKEVIASYPLGGLSDEDADTFLQAVPILEEDIRTQIISSSNGLPFYLDLQVSTYEAIREREDTPTAEQFGGAPSDILARFLEHLSDADQGTLRLASYLQIITQPVMDALAEAFPGRAVNYSFQRMTARSSFEEISDGTFEIHALMKEELQRREKEENTTQFKKTHQWLFEWFDKQISREVALRFDLKETRLENCNFALHHAIRHEHRAILPWGLELRVFLSLDSEWDILEAVYRAALDSKISGDTGLSEQWIAQNNLSCVLHEKGEKTEALSFQNDLCQSIRALPVDDQWVAQMVEHNLRIIRGDTDFAEASKTLDVGFDAICSPEVAEYSRFILETSLGRTFLAAQEYEKALPILARTASNALINKKQSAWIAAFAMQDLAHCLRCLNRFDEAEPIARLALSLFSPSLLKMNENERPKDQNPQSDNDDFDLLEPETTSELLFRKVTMNFTPQMFRSGLRDGIIDHYSGLKNFSEEALNSKEHLSLEWPSAFKKEPPHPHSASIVSALLEGLDEIDETNRYLPAFKRTGYQIKVYSANGIDFTNHFEGKAIIAHLSEEMTSTSPFVNIQFFCAVYQAMIELGGFRPPAAASGLSSLASYHHGATLDIFSAVCECIQTLSGTTKEKYLATMSSEMLRFYRATETSAPREELYEIYVDMFQAARSFNP